MSRLSAAFSTSHSKIVGLLVPQTSRLAPKRRPHFIIFGHLGRVTHSIIFDFPSDMATLRGQANGFPEAQSDCGRCGQVISRKVGVCCLNLRWRETISHLHYIGDRGKVFCDEMRQPRFQQLLFVSGNRDRSIFRSPSPATAPSHRRSSDIPEIRPEAGRRDAPYRRRRYRDAGGHTRPSHIRRHSAF